MFMTSLCLIGFFIIMIFPTPSIMSLMICLLSILILIIMMKNWHHVIMILILMEMLMLQAFFFLAWSSMFMFSLNAVFLFSSLMVIEASLGMSMLACISRSHGDEYILIF